MNQNLLEKASELKQEIESLPEVKELKRLETGFNSPTLLHEQIKGTWLL